MTNVLQDTNNSSSNFGAYAITLQNQFAAYPNTLTKNLQDIASKHNVHFLMSKLSKVYNLFVLIFIFNKICIFFFSILLLYKDVDDWAQSGVGNLNVETTKKLSQMLNLKGKDTLLLAYGNKTNAVSKYYSFVSV